jgi:hypothetical protein
MASEIKVNTIKDLGGNTIVSSNGSGTISGLPASAISSGTVATARLGSGTASSSTFLAGDSSYKTVTGTTINTNADNRVITGSGTANTLTGETNLTYDGTTFQVSNSSATSDMANIKTDADGIVALGLEKSDYKMQLGLDVANDGSQNFFIRERHQGGSNTNAVRLVIDSAGKVGIGTTPTLALDISSTDPRIYMIDTTNSASTYKTKFGQYNDTFLISTNNGDNDAIKIYATGEVTKPLQPVFLVRPTSDQVDLPTGSTTVAWGAEIFDVGSNFASNTFTAPVTGKYQFNLSAYLNHIDVDTTLFEFNFVSSNRLQRLMIMNPSKDYTSDSNEFHSMNASAILDMDANDTVYVRIDITGGGGVIHLNGSAPSSAFYTSWSGALIC